MQLIGWCQSSGELLLVYELMPNGSLDRHLYNEEKILSWPVRYGSSPLPSKHFVENTIFNFICAIFMHEIYMICSSVPTSGLGAMRSAQGYQAEQHHAGQILQHQARRL